jgi:hypothetical protein
VGCNVNIIVMDSAGETSEEMKEIVFTFRVHTIHKEPLHYTPGKERHSLHMNYEEFRQ